MAIKNVSIKPVSSLVGKTILIRYFQLFQVPVHKVKAVKPEIQIMLDAVRRRIFRPENND